MEKESDMKLTFTAKMKAVYEGTVSRHIHSHVKWSIFFYIPVVSFGYLIVCRVSAYQTGFSEEDTSVSCHWLSSAYGVKCLSG